MKIERGVGWVAADDQLHSATPAEYVARIAELEKELARVRAAHLSIINEVMYGGTDLNDEPDIDRIHDFARVGLADMLQRKT